MKVLAIETSSIVASCAICQEQKILGSSSLNIGLEHSKTLMVLVEGLFKNSKTSIEEIGAVAVSVGPGSFTGVRIGVAAAKGIALGRNIPLVGVDSLKALAYNLLGFQGLVCCCVDARRNTVYSALFELDGSKILRKTKDFVEEILKLKEILKKEQKKIFLVGDAAVKVYEQIKDVGNIFVAPPRLMFSSACSVGFLAQEQLKSGLKDEEVLPKYLKESQAERERAEKLKKEQDE